MSNARARAVVDGYTVDRTIYPWCAYKGARFAPDEWHEVHTDLESELLAALERAADHFAQLGHDALCNGVHAPDGQCEGMHWASETESIMLEAIAKARGVA